MNRNWKDDAVRLFFIEGKNVTEISEEIRISRQSLSRYFNTLPNYKNEKELRKAENSDRREYFREYRQEERQEERQGRYNLITSDSLRVEHIKAVLLLSKERFCE